MSIPPGMDGGYPTTRNEAAERRCEATRPRIYTTGDRQCSRPRWKGHVTRFCYQHAIAMGEAKVVDTAAVDLLIAAAKAKGAREAVERIRKRVPDIRFHIENGEPNGLDVVWVDDVTAILDEEAAR